MEWIFVLVLGLMAGVLTTLAGLGGGLLLLLALGLLWDPATALVVSAPALLVGNLHRLALLRRAVDPRKGMTFAAGALPAAALAGASAMLAPPIVVTTLIATMTVAAIGIRICRCRWRVATPLLAPAGIGVGALTGAGGGAGVLTAPILLASDLRGEAYVATAAFCAASIHAGRLLGYGAMGFVGVATLAHAAGLATAIALGNHLGRRWRRHAERVPEGLLEHGVLAACVMLSLWMMG